jgi:hypothetical protein
LTSQPGAAFISLFALRAGFDLFTFEQAMHLECHAVLGWAIANMGAPKPEQRGIRNFTVVSAILPDIDAAAYLFGPFYYGLYHHTFGHNVFLWILWSLWGVKRYGSWRAGLLAFVAFGSHLLSDAYMSNWFLYLFWPVSQRGFLPAGSLDLSSPVNTGLLYATPLFLLVIALIWKRTPLEWIHPKLDGVFVSFFRRKFERCGETECGGGANVRCDQCGKALCPRHLNLAKGWRVLCPPCKKL